MRSLTISSNRQLAWIVGIVFGVAALVSFSWWLWRDTQQSKTQTTETGAPVIPTPTPDPLAPITVALLGYGGGNHQGGSLTDTILIAKIKPRLQQVLLVSVPRDLWVSLPAPHPPGKVNIAYSLSGDVAKQALSDVTGWQINKFVAVSFAGFTQAIDSLGGVSVKVPFSFVDEFYPIEGLETADCGRSPEDIAALTATMSGFILEQQFPCRYEKLEFAAGQQTLVASAALKFVRSRHSDVNGNDFGRSLRQQALLQGLRQKLTTPSFWPQLPGFFSKVVKLVHTDITASDVTTAIATFPNLANYQLQSYSLTPQTGLVASQSADRQFILVPQPQLGWSGLHQQLTDWENLIATKSTQTATPSSSQPSGSVQSSP
jgi:anionic cell wall polymer biosynthesis LytR-Cps2A-Psr (LCP) family protein